MQFEASPMARKITQRKQHRQGYVLVMCLLVVAISSCIVLTLFNMLSMQTAESRARRQIVASSSIMDAGVEHAVAILMDRPTFRGNAGTFRVPALGTSAAYTIDIVDNSGDAVVTVRCQVGASTNTRSINITAAQIAQRKSEAGV